MIWNFIFKKFMMTQHVLEEEINSLHFTIHEFWVLVKNIDLFDILIHIKIASGLLHLLRN